MIGEIIAWIIGAFIALAMLLVVAVLVLEAWYELTYQRQKREYIEDVISDEDLTPGEKHDKLYRIGIDEMGKIKKR